MGKHISKGVNNIVIVTPLLSGKGGTETVLKTVLGSKNYVFENNISLFILGNKSKNEWALELNDNVTVKFFSENRIKSTLLLLLNLMCFRYKKIVCLSTKILYFSYCIKKLFNRRLVLISWIHFSLFNEKTVDVTKLKYADYHLAISTGILKQLEKLGIGRNKIKLVFNPVSYKKRTIPRSSSKQIKLVYVGRILLNGQKNLKELFDSLCYFKNNTIDIDIYGDGQIKECKEYIKENNIKQNFYWHGWMSNPWDSVKSADATILTSKYEGFPMVLLESISYGIPVISSNCPTGPEDIICDTNGFIYSMGNPQDLADKINLLNGLNIDRQSIKKTIENFYTDKFIKNFWTQIFNLN